MNSFDGCNGGLNSVTIHGSIITPRSEVPTPGAGQATHGRARRTIRTHLSGTCPSRSSGPPFQYRIEGDDLTITRTGHKLNGTGCCPHFAFRAEGAPASDEHRLCSVSYTPPDAGEPARGLRPRGRTATGDTRFGSEPRSNPGGTISSNGIGNKTDQPVLITSRAALTRYRDVLIGLIPDTTARAQYVAKGSSPVELAIHKLDRGSQQGVCQVVTRPIEPADIVLIDAKGTTIASHADPPSHLIPPSCSTPCRPTRASVFAVGGPSNRAGMIRPAQSAEVPPLDFSIRSSCAGSDRCPRRRPNRKFRQRNGDLLSRS